MRNAPSWARATLAAGVGLGMTALLAAPAAAAPAASTAPRVQVFASGSATMTQPDDITRLGRDIFVLWQNGVGPMGQPSPTGVTKSTITEYDPNGSLVHRWGVTGHADGLTADPAAGDVIVTVNEDGNSSLFTIDPSAAPGSEVTHYRYQPNPLPHGGGTDAVSIYHGQILVSASAPTAANGPAVYRVRLDEGVATVQPVFFDDSTATVANTNLASYGQPVSLALTDPDSNEVVPMSSPRFAGDFVLDSQGDDQQIYVRGADTSQPRLSVLDLSQSVDDTAFVTSPHGTLFVTDGVDNEVFALRGSLRVGGAYVAVTPGNANVPVAGPNYLGSLNLATGAVSPVVTSVQAKGLLFVP